MTINSVHSEYELSEGVKHLLKILNKFVVINGNVETKLVLAPVNLQTVGRTKY